VKRLDGTHMQAMVDGEVSERQRRQRGRSGRLCGLIVRLGPPPICKFWIGVSLIVQNFLLEHDSPMN